MSGNGVDTTSHPWCSGKVRYETREKARAARAHVPGGRELDAFACPYCHGYHLGGDHRPSKRRRT